MEHIHNTHTPEHSHSHSDGDGNVHTHSYSSDAHPLPVDIKQAKALLEYMVRHNEHHAEEFADLLEVLPKKAYCSYRHI